jgi:hypothetical protein
MTQNSATTVTVIVAARADCTQVGSSHKNKVRESKNSLETLGDVKKALKKESRSSGISGSPRRVITHQ